MRTITFGNFNLGTFVSELWFQDVNLGKWIDKGPVAGGTAQRRWGIGLQRSVQKQMQIQAQIKTIRRLHFRGAPVCGESHGSCI